MKLCVNGSIIIFGSYAKNLQKKTSDFVLKEGINITQCIQVCYKITPENKARELKGLINAMKKFEVKTGYIVTQNQTEKLELDGLNVFILTEKNFRKKFGMDSE